MREQFFHGHGKLLLSGEYFILDGAKSLALPTSVGQTMTVKYKRSNDPKMTWKSYDTTGKCWFEATLELWQFELQDNQTEEAKMLQTILRQARKQNVHFLRDEQDVIVETRLEFPRTWGLGSSSTLIYTIAQWAYISPFELQAKTFGGSGYDIACAQAMGPMSYEIKNSGPRWESVSFNPIFTKNIYFIYLNRKQNTRESIERYRSLNESNGEKIQELSQRISEITDQILNSIDLKEFEQLVFEHENIISKVIDMPRIQDQYFSDYWGSVKSLGGWGGDFAMVTSYKSAEETKAYFSKRGYETFLSYGELICQSSNVSNISNPNENSIIEELRH